MDLNSFSVTPSSGSIVWTGPWALTTFVHVANSNGDVDFQLQTDSSNASSSASVPYASANSSASIPAMGGRFASVEGAVNVPNGIDASASILGSSSALENSFMIAGASGFVDVSFGALLSSTLSVMTNAEGLGASADVIFNLSLDGAPVLSFFDILTVGSSSSSFSSMSPSLTQTLSLDSSQSYYFSLSLLTNLPPGTNTPVPDQVETWILMLIGLGGVAARRLFATPDSAR